MQFNVQEVLSITPHPMYARVAILAFTLTNWDKPLVLNVRRINPLGKCTPKMLMNAEVRRYLFKLFYNNVNVFRYVSARNSGPKEEDQVIEAAEAFNSGKGYVESLLQILSYRNLSVRIWAN